MNETLLATITMLTRNVSKTRLMMEIMKTFGYRLLTAWALPCLARVLGDIWALQLKQGALLAGVVWGSPPNLPAWQGSLLFDIPATPKVCRITSFWTTLTGLEP